MIVYQRSKIKQEEFREEFLSLSYLRDKIVIANVRGRKLRIYGHAGTPELGSSPAFQYTEINEEQAKDYRVWSRMPQDTNIVVFQGPPLHLCDHKGLLRIIV